MWDNGTLSATETPMHTFPSGTWVPDEGSIVVFGAITEENAANEMFGNAIVQSALTDDGVAKFNGIDLSLQNVYMTLYNQYGYAVDEFNFLKDLGSQDSSVVRNPDITGELDTHFNASPIFKIVSPGLDLNDNPFPGNGMVEVPKWVDWDILEGDFVNTTGFLGWLYIGMEPWVYSYALDNWIWIEGDNVTATGGWGYISR